MFSTCYKTFKSVLIWQVILGIKKVAVAKDGPSTITEVYKLCLKKTQLIERQSAITKPKPTQKFGKWNIPTICSVSVEEKNSQFVQKDVAYHQIGGPVGTNPETRLHS